MTKQYATREFCDWLDTTSFSGVIKPGEHWDTEEAWPSPETMRAARECFRAFKRGDLKSAEELMWRAQAPFV